MEKQGNRLLALEGLRGVAALVVVLFHSLLIFYPAFYYGMNPAFALLRNSKVDGFLYGNPLSVFLSGTFAVAIFFVLSGFVLTIGFFQTNDQAILRKLAAKRYIRLMLPALASIVLVWFLLSLGLGAHKGQVAAISGSTWLANIWPLSPNLGNALMQGLRSIFSSGDVTYNPVLWTMQYELIGSFLVFLIAIIFKEARFRWVIYGLIILGTIQTWYAAFMIGLVLADLYSSKTFPFSRPSKALMVFILFVGLFLGGYPYIEVGGTVYQTMHIGWMSDVENQTVYLTLGAALLLIATLTLPPVTRAFSSRPISTLGKYTFSVYLTHMPVIFIVTTSLFLWLHTFMGFNAAAGVSIVMTFPIIALVAYMFERYIDAPSIRLSGVFANWILGLPQKQGVTAYTERSPTWSLRSMYSGVKERVVTLSKLKKERILIHSENKK